MNLQLKISEKEKPHKSRPELRKGVLKITGLIVKKNVD